MGGKLAQSLGERILSGKLKEGHAFPGEVEFAAQLGISRSVLREALRVLVSKGLVEGRPKAGTRVTLRQQWNLLDPDILAWQFASEPSSKFIEDLFALRMILEPEAAALAATRRTEAHIADMRQALAEMSSQTLATEEGRLADQRFHLAILNATGNELILALASSILAAIAWTTIYKQRERELPRNPIPDHAAVLECIANADPQAARLAMTTLIRLALADTKMSRRQS